jgi:hypothetical protein
MVTFDLESLTRLLPIAVASLCGGLLGAEREMRGSVAGLRITIRPQKQLFLLEVFASSAAIRRHTTWQPAFTPVLRTQTTAFGNSSPAR